MTYNMCMTRLKFRSFGSVDEADDFFGFVDDDEELSDDVVDCWDDEESSDDVVDCWDDELEFSFEEILVSDEVC